MFTQVFVPLYLFIIQLTAVCDRKMDGKMDRQDRRTKPV